MPLQIFGKSSKNPSDVVRSLKEALITLESKENNTATGETSGMLMEFKVSLKVEGTFGHNQDIGGIKLRFRKQIAFLLFLTVTGGAGTTVSGGRDKKQEKAQEELSKQLQNTKRLASLVQLLIN